MKQNIKAGVHKNGEHQWWQGHRGAPVAGTCAINVQAAIVELCTKWKQNIVGVREHKGTPTSYSSHKIQM